MPVAKALIRPLAVGAIRVIDAVRLTDGTTTAVDKATISTPTFMVRLDMCVLSRSPGTVTQEPRP